MPPATEGRETRHIPVLLTEVLQDFAPLFAAQRPVRILDATLGLGGHTEAMLEACPNVHVLGLDRDSAALAIAKARLARFGDRFCAVQSRFSGLGAALDQVGWERIDGALADIGVSSLQLDEAGRGFSVYADGPLDMRMDPSQGQSARDIVNFWDAKSLRDLIATLGEDPMAPRIAKAIVEARGQGPIETTCRLSEVVRLAYPAAMRAKSRHHPATRTFQALRMQVNGELDELGAFLGAVFGRLNVGGILQVISFHSLEDRMVKRAMRAWAEGCRCSRFASRCTCGHVPEAEILHKKPLVACEDELAANSRASSAKLRACVKLCDWAPPAKGGQA